MEKLFVLAGLAMCAHTLCSLILLVTLHNNPLAEELFALPNAWLGPRPRWLSIRLLRGKFLLPWVPSPVAMSECSPVTRAIFFLARVSGAAFPLAILAFLVAVFVLASR
jgi:hypothetical protein